MHVSNALEGFHVMSHVSVLRPRNLAWIPAAMLISVGLLSAMGVSLIPDGRAATATGGTVISATVLPEVSLDLAQNQAGAAACGTIIDATVNAEVAEFGNAGSRIPINSSGATNLGTCNMTFGTNNGATGASLSYKSDRPATANRTFCTTAVGLTCAGTFYTDDDGANATLEADRFGVRLDTENCDTNTMVLARYYGAPLSGAAAQDVCTGEAASATPANDGHVILSFHVNTSTTASGDYNARLNFTATAN